MTGQDGIDFCTLGMFIIDEIEFPPPKAPVKDIIGGAGSYSALGARIFSPPPKSTSVGWIVDCGSDFPSELREAIAHWNTSCMFRETLDRLTTRGWNGYGENEHRAFRYTTPKLRLDHDALANTELLWSKSFHLICSPTRCMDLVANILAMRGLSSMMENRANSRPIFIWEPVPDLCTAEELTNCFRALKIVDVVSPNHSELSAFFGQRAHGDGVDHRAIEDLCNQWLESGIGNDGQGGIVVRAGRAGCLVAHPGFRKWIPAYHQSASKVVDPTGGGNGFLGGLAVGLVRSGTTMGRLDLNEAAIWGSIAASFAIEQVGMPRLEGDQGSETWNGFRVDDRLSEFRSGLESYVQP
ncbi:Ribokinase-like protein [Lophiotrema nucula]|uniref:Ribokinase-like protein n=1 Tax=Lophiotrema nucula TaxID=690887 RepID=A0A6A5ZSS7_9PLEO|nr:Ribokinase-like protein [Lophiotrema nucula]